MDEAIRVFEIPIIFILSTLLLYIIFRIITMAMLRSLEDFYKRRGRKVSLMKSEEEKK
jgi:hypothetical protein